MFIGHFAMGFAGKRWAPRQSLGVLLVAPAFVDILWPVFCALGIESFHIQPGNSAYQPLVFDSYPWSHSLLMGIVWGALFGAVVYRLSGDRAGGVVTGLLVVSHWVLDFVSHVPDMPLWPGGPKLGLGLWNSVPLTVAVEGALFVAGVAIYLRATRARDRIGSIGIWAYIVFLALLYAASSNGAPPPSTRVVIIMGILAPVIFTPIAWWIDQHREVVA